MATQPTGLIMLPNTSMKWDESRDEIQFELYNQVVKFSTNYDGGRELLDCLMVLFAKTELITRYPEVR